jgi:RHS repeat-associated protein
MSFCTVPYSPKWSRVAHKDLASGFSPEWGNVSVPGRRSSSFCESIVGDRSIHDSESNRFEVPCSARRLSSLVSSSLVSSVSLRNAENRLTKIEDGSTLKATYQYDFMGRRVRKQVGSVVTWYVYDGFNELGRFTQSGGSAPVIERTFTWGLDISNSPQGAGGVGGLLAVKVHGTTSATYFPTYDANGNISEYLASNGSVAAHFEYDGFGNTVVNTDTNGLFDYRFSTKPLEDVSGLYYYLYRDYDPVTGRWPSRDPIEEEGGSNLHGSVSNRVVNNIDYLGLKYNVEQRYMEMSDLFRMGGYHSFVGSPSWGKVVPEILTDRDDYVYVSSDGKSAEVVIARQIDVDVLAVYPTTNVANGISYSAQGMMSLVGHELKREEIYRMAYEEYINPIDTTGDIAIKCGCIYRSEAGEAEKALRDYLENNRKIGVTEFVNYAQKEQRELGAESSSSNWIHVRGERDRYRITHTIASPSPARWEPCPKSQK